MMVIATVRYIFEGGALALLAPLWICPWLMNIITTFMIINMGPIMHMQLLKIDERNSIDVTK